MRDNLGQRPKQVLADTGYRGERVAARDRPSSRDVPKWGQCAAGTARGDSAYRTLFIGSSDPDLAGALLGDTRGLEVAPFTWCVGQRRRVDTPGRIATFISGIDFLQSDSVVSTRRCSRSPSMNAAPPASFLATLCELRPATVEIPVQPSIVAIGMVASSESGWTLSSTGLQKR